MNDRAEQLHTAAEGQISELSELISHTDAEALHRPCPGREKLGDGTIGANAAHTASSYERIATFVSTSRRKSGRHGGGQRSGHRIRGLPRALGHTPPAHRPADPGLHDDGFTVESADPLEIVKRLRASGDTLGRIAELTDRQLDSVPPKDTFRFCDGERTLEQVLLGLLKHQDHQVQALRAALTGTP
jgi:hypothetical protein